MNGAGVLWRDKVLAYPLGILDINLFKMVVTYAEPVYRLPQEQGKG
jgi:hypothetical protein